MIVITGATGQLGSRVLERLLERVPTEQVGVSVRDPARARDLAARGVRVRRGDFAEPGSLADAFEGATQVLLVSGSTTGPEARTQHHHAIDAARDAGAERILYTSHQAAAPGSLFAPMPDHAATEQHLVGLGTPFTSLRNGFYASTIPRLLGAALQTGELVAPADGPVSWTAHADLAEAAAVVLSEPGRFDGATPPLTGSAALDLEDVAGLLSELSGRTIRRVVVQDEEFAATMVSHGVPQAQAQLLVGLFQAARRGEFATVDPTLADLVGHEPVSVRSLLEGLVAAA